MDKINQRAWYNRIWSWSPVTCEKHGPQASGLSNDKILGLRPLLLSTESLGPCLSHSTGDHDQILHPHSTLNLNVCVCPFILDHTNAHACRNISIFICICTVLQQNIISIFVCMRQFVLHMYFSCFLKFHIFVTDIYCMLPISLSPWQTTAHSLEAAPSG